MDYRRRSFQGRLAVPQRGTDSEPLENHSEEAARREAEYLRHLSEGQKSVTVHMVTGESFQGVIEYYDRRFIRLTRLGAPNLFIFKKDIKYLSEG